MSLASLLPYDHAYAGGYPGLSSQALPTDADALDYLARVKAADGAGVEVGVATAVDAFFRDLKSTGQEYDGVYRTTFESLKACCILCGARTLNGALVPLAGAAPANNNFISDDYTRGGATPGLKGDGSTKYLDSNRANDADPQNDNHWSIYITSVQTVAGRSAFGSGDNVAVSYNYHRTNTGGNAGKPQLQNNVAANYNTTGELEAPGLSATSRASSGEYDWVSGGQADVVTAASVNPNSYKSYVLSVNSEGSPAIYSDARLAFYSIGESLDLAALDDAVSTLVTAIGAAI